MTFQSVLPKLDGKLEVIGINAVACAKAESLGFESLEELPQLLLRRMRNDNAARTCFAKRNVLGDAKIADTIEVAEEIQHKRFARGEQGEDRRPEVRGLLSANRLPAFRLQNFQADRF